MKTPIAVVLIIMGGLIVMTPAVSDYFYQQNLVAVLNHGAASVNLDGKMGDLYRILCWSLGGGMIAISILFSLYSVSGDKTVVQEKSSAQLV